MIEHIMEISPLKIKAIYHIEYTKKVLGLFDIKKIFDIRTSISEFFAYKDRHAELILNIISMKTNVITGYNHLAMQSMHHTGPVHLFFYKVNDGQKVFRVLEIKDIVVEPKFRSLGIGSKLLKLIEEIGKQNNVSYIFGVLEPKDQFEDDLEPRKDFFMKNNFQLMEDSRFRMSNICAVKFIH